MDQSSNLRISHSLFPEETVFPKASSWEAYQPWKSLDQYCGLFFFSFHTWRTKVASFMFLSAFQESVYREPMGLTPRLALLNSKNIERKHVSVPVVWREQSTCLSAMTSAIVSSLFQFWFKRWGRKTELNQCNLAFRCRILRVQRNVEWI